MGGLNTTTLLVIYSITNLVSPCMAFQGGVAHSSPFTSDGQGLQRVSAGAPTVLRWCIRAGLFLAPRLGIPARGLPELAGACRFAEPGFDRGERRGRRRLSPVSREARGQRGRTTRDVARSLARIQVPRAGAGWACFRGVPVRAAGRRGWTTPPRRQSLHARHCRSWA